jgi:tight adherence protein B
MDQTLIVFGVLLFVAVVLGLEGVYQTWVSKHGKEAKRLTARMSQLDGSTGHDAPLSIERREAQGRFDWLERSVVQPLAGGQRVMAYVRSADAGVGVGAMLMLSVVAAVVGYAIPALTAKPAVFSLLLGGVLAALPWFWLGGRRQKRIEIFERQVPEALDLMGRALRAGHAFPTAVKMVADEMPPPIAGEFRVLADQANFGVPMNQALLNLADRVPVGDMRYFVVAVLIQRETGGNLAELLDSIASIVRGRIKLLGEIRVLSAEGKMSAWVLGILPFALATVMYLVNRNFLAILWTDPMGLKMIGGGLVLMVLGAWWMSRIIKIRV